MNRLAYDLKISAAQEGFFLKAYYSDVDHDGFDIIFDSDDIIKKIQVKTVLGGTNSWLIHKALLRPSFGCVELFGFEPTPESLGVQGGVILMAIDTKDDGDCSIKYYYTDIFVLAAYELELVPAKRQRKNKAMEILTLVNEIFTGEANQKVAVAKGMFIEVTSAATLLKVMLDRSLQHNILALRNHEKGDQTMSLSTDVEVLKKHVSEELKGL